MIELLIGVPHVPVPSCIFSFELVVLLEVVPLDEIVQPLYVFLDVSMHEEVELVEHAAIDFEVASKIAFEDIDELATSV